MKKEKFCIEYVFDNASKTSLWNHLTTPTGLSEWFADDVSIDGNIFTFTWNKFSEEAEQIAISPFSYTRFRWLDENDPKVFFEFRLQTNEITGGIVLEITDFAEEDEKEESITLWDSQIKILKRTLGL
jgi:uncharacterized protein YndB with AHSA1/START domain